IADITQNKAGSKTAEKKQDAPLVEKKADPKEMKDLVEKISKQPEVKPAAAPPPPSEEEKKKEVAKPEKKPETKPEPTKEALKKPEPPKKPEKKPQEQAKDSSATKMKAAPTKREFDPNKIAALLNRQDPQRHEVTNQNLNARPSPGYAQGQS